MEAAARSEVCDQAGTGGARRGARSSRRRGAPPRGDAVEVNRNGAWVVAEVTFAIEGGEGGEGESLGVRLAGKKGEEEAGVAPGRLWLTACALLLRARLSGVADL